jgi:pimeloyl-ACP methyl ester carboxylesterase
MIRVGNAEIYVVEEGAGPLLLFLHGNPDSSHLWLDLIARLKDSFRCVAPDLPGFGRSGVPEGFECSLDGLAGFVEQFVNEAGLPTPLDLVVHDFGGIFGLAWAVRHAARVRRIVVMNTVFHTDYRWHPWARVWRTPILGELSMALMNRPLFAREMSSGSPGLTRAQIDATYDRITPRMKRMVLRLYRASEPRNYAGWQDELLSMAKRVPICVLWGDRDPYIAPRFAERFGAREVHHFRERGHFLPLEAPYEVAAHMRDFLGRPF